MPEKKELIRMLHTMRKIRHFEERLTALHTSRSFLKSGDTAGDQYDMEGAGIITGSIHLSIGQEAVAAGVCAALNDDDYIATYHRGHGHAIAKGVGLAPLMAELMGRRDGCCRGCGGSLHIFDPGCGLLGGNGIIGAQVPLATGAAFSARYRGTRQVSVAFFGDGAANQGSVHEAMNMAALWRLPVLFVCENNLYANTTPVEIALATPDVADRAAAYGMPGEIVDGQNVSAVYETARKAVRRARDQEGPTLIECKTYRFMRHCGGEESLHEDPEELAVWKKRDPVVLFEDRLLKDGVMTAEQQRKLKETVMEEIEEAVEFGKNCKFPDIKDLQELAGGEL